MENEMIQKSVPNEPLEGMPEEYEDPELLEEKLEEEVGESEGIVIDAGDDEEIIEERPEHLKAAKGKKSNPTLNKQKKQILYASLPVMVLWAAWACYEMVWKHDLPKSFSWVLTISMLIGGIVGGIWGYCVERKGINAAQDIIDEIEKN